MLDVINEILTTLSGFIWGQWVMIPLLLLTGVYLTARLGGIQFRKFFHALGCIIGLYDDPEDEGEISHFEALSAALSATIGIGNIGGVATAIHMGGPGALFWMWITALLGMATKFASCTLSLKYRTKQEDGSIMGGPMVYIEKGLGQSWKWLAVTFAVCAAGATFGIGNMVQANNAAAILQDDFKIPVFYSGIVIAGMIWLVIVGGIKRIGDVASRLVPFMATLYVVSCLAILFTHAGELPAAFQTVFSSAFTGTAATGGFLGSAFALTLRFGVARGLFSNESGLGSAPIAHAAARTDEPVREGLVAMVGPFIDTLVICSLTALTIIVTGAWHKKHYNNRVDMNSVDVLVRTDESNITNRKNGKSLAEIQSYSGTLNVRDGVIDNGVMFRVNHGIASPPERDLLPETFKIDDEPQKPLIVESTTGAGWLKRLFMLQEQTRTLYTGTLTVREGVVVKTSSNGELFLFANTLKNQVSLTREAFVTGFKRIAGMGNLGGMLITIAVVLFAFSTAITWSYYGDRCVEYLFGMKSRIAYRWIFVGAFVIGSLVTLDLVWNLADVLNGLMAIPNLIALLFLSGTVVKLTKEYLSREHIWTSEEEKSGDK